MIRALLRSARASARASLAMLLLLVATPIALPVAPTSAAEVGTTELVSGVPNAVVYAQPGQAVFFPIQVSAGGYLLPGITEQSPATAQVRTEYLLATWGSSSYTPSAPQKFWPKDSLGNVTWYGAPTPYTVQASVYVAPSVPHGEYRIPIVTTVATPVIGPQSLMLTDTYQDSFVVHVEPPTDTTAPVTLSALTGATGEAGWFLSDVQVALTATDAGSGVALTEYSLDQGDTWQQYQSPFTVTAEGASTIYYRSLDVAGNAEDYKSCSAAIDKTDPSVDVLAAAEGSTCGCTTLDCAAVDPPPGSGLAGVDLFLDGSPVAIGTELGVPGTHTVTAVAVDLAGRTAQHSHTFTIHAGGPEITIVSPTAGPHREAQTFDFTVADEYGIASVTSDPTLGHTWDAEGAYTATVSASDSLGNLATAAVDFMIDSTCPTTTADVEATLGENGWWLSGATVRLNANDPVSGGVTSGIAGTQVRVDGGSWTQLGDACSVAGDGAHTVDYFSVDYAGNEEPIQSLSVNVDSAPPSVQPSIVGSLGSGGFYVGPTSLEISGSDAQSGLARCEYNVDDTAWVTYASPVAVEPGTHAIKVRSYDVAGNVSAEELVNVSVDSAAPNTTSQLSGPSGANGWYTGGVQISFAAEDGSVGSGVDYTEYSLDDGVTWIRATGAPVTIEGPGTVSVQYRSADRAGNVETALSEVVSIDSADPSVSYSGVSDGARLAQALISYDALDAEPGSGLNVVSATLNGLPIGQNTFLLVEGPYDLEVTATDVSGRTASVSAWFFIDGSAPSIVIASPLDGSISAADQTVSFSVTDDGPVSWTSNYPNGYAFTSEGAYTVTVDATDEVGWTAQKSASFVIDRTAPVVSPELAGTPGSPGWWISDVQVALNASDPVSGGASSGISGLRFAVDGGAWADYVAPFVVSDGQHTISWEATDRAGNSTVGSTSIAVDTVHPVVSATSPATGSTYLYGQSVTLDFAFSDAGSGLLGPGQATFNNAAVARGQTLVMTQPGPNGLRLVATDAAGNVTDETFPCTVAFNGGAWIVPPAGQTTWKAGQQLKAQFQIFDFAGMPTDAAVVTMVVRVNGTVTTGTAVVLYPRGVPTYEYAVKTVKGQTGDVIIEASCNDGVTVLTKTLTLTQ